MNHCQKNRSQLEKKENAKISDNTIYIATYVEQVFLRFGVFFRRFLVQFDGIFVLLYWYWILVVVLVYFLLQLQEKLGLRGITINILFGVLF